MRDLRDLIPFVSRARFDLIWRENAELRGRFGFLRALMAAEAVGV